jgi:hypothetical protein
MPTAQTTPGDAFKDEFSKMSVTSSRNSTGCPKLTLFLWVAASLVTASVFGLIGWATITTISAVPTPPLSAASTQRLHDYEERLRHDEAKQARLTKDVKTDIALTQGLVAKVKDAVDAGDVAQLKKNKAALFDELSTLRTDETTLKAANALVKKDVLAEQEEIDSVKQEIAQQQQVANKGGSKKKETRGRRLRVAGAA